MNKLKKKLEDDLHDLVNEFLFICDGDNRDLLEAFTFMTPKILAYSFKEENLRNPEEAAKKYGDLIAMCAIDACKQLIKLNNKGLH